MPNTQRREFEDWPISALALEAVRIIRWNAADGCRSAQVSMDNPSKDEVEMVCMAAFWDGKTEAFEDVLSPLFPEGEAWKDCGPYGPCSDAREMLLTAKRKCSSSEEALRVEIAISLLDRRSDEDDDDDDDDD